MDYKLNKIDTELRNAVNEQTREGKIHTKTGIVVNSERGKEDFRRKKEYVKDNKKEPFSISKYVGANKVLEVNVYKSDSIEIEVEKEENVKKDYNKGLYIDIRK